MLYLRVQFDDSITAAQTTWAQLFCTCVRFYLFSIPLLPSPGSRPKPGRSQPCTVCIRSRPDHTAVLLYGWRCRCAHTSIPQACELCIMVYYNNHDFQWIAAFLGDRRYKQISPSRTKSVTPAFFPGINIPYSRGPGSSTCLFPCKSYDLSLLLFTELNSVTFKGSTVESC